MMFRSFTFLFAFILVPAAVVAVHSPSVNAGTAAPAESARTKYRCEQIFASATEVSQTAISGTQLVAKYGEQINSFRRFLKVSEARSTEATPQLQGQQIARLIRNEADGDPSVFWRLFYIAMTEANQAAYSSEFYQALLQDLFVASHDLVHPKHNKGTQYLFFDRVIIDAFRRVRNLESTVTARGPVANYANEIWIPTSEMMRAETTLQNIWPAKILKQTSVLGAEEAGRNLAEHIKKNSSDLQTYVRFYYLALSTMKSPQSEAFYRGLLDQRYLETYRSLSPISKRLIDVGLKNASQLSQQKIEPTPNRHDVEKILAKAAKKPGKIPAEVELRALLLKTRTMTETVMELIEKKAEKNPSLFARLVYIALTENQFYGSDTLPHFADQALKAAQTQIITIEDAAKLQAVLRELPAPTNSYANKVWGKTPERAAAEVSLRKRAKKAVSYLNIATKRTAERYGEELADWVQSISVEGNVGNAQSVYTQFLYILLTDFKFKNADFFYRGLLNFNHREIAVKLDQNFKDRIKRGIEIAAFANELEVSKIGNSQYLKALTGTADENKSLNLQVSRKTIRAFIEQKRKARGGRPASAKHGLALAKLIFDESKGASEDFIDLLEKTVDNEILSASGPFLEEFRKRTFQHAQDIALTPDQMKEVARLIQPIVTFGKAREIDLLELQLRNLLATTPVSFRSSNAAHLAGERVSALLNISQREGTSYAFTPVDAHLLHIVFTEHRVSQPAFYRAVLGRSFRSHMYGMNREDHHRLMQDLRDAGI